MDIPRSIRRGPCGRELPCQRIIHTAQSSVGLVGAVPRVAREPPGCHDSVGRVPVGDRSPVKARPDPCAAVAGSGCVLLCCAADTIMRTRQRLDALLLEMQLDPADADQVNVIMNTQEAALEMVRPGVT